MPTSWPRSRRHRPAAERPPRQRDTILTQLAQYTNVTTTSDSDGALNVFIGNGQALVLRNVHRR